MRVENAYVATNNNHDCTLKLDCLGGVDFVNNDQNISHLDQSVKTSRSRDKQVVYDLTDILMVLLLKRESIDFDY